MANSERAHRIKWVQSELERLHERLMTQYFPLLQGLPIDDPQMVTGIIETMRDDDLATLSRLSDSELVEWARQQMHEMVSSDRFSEEAVEVLVQHVGDLLAEHVGISDQDIESAIRYYAARASTVNLIERFEDDESRWLALVELVRKDGTESEE